MKTAVFTLVVAAVVASFLLLKLPFAEVFSSTGAAQMGAYARGFFPPDFSGEFVARAAHGTVETLAVSAVGTLLAGFLGLLLALPAASRRFFVRQPARLFLNGLRAVPELVWAAIMVLAAGLGPLAGTLALAFHTAGVLGRLFAESIENTPPEPADALRLLGSRPATAFLYGAWPNLAPQFLAYLLYRWENNIRMAAILGFVGAGGLGQMLYVSLSLFQQRQAATLILAMLALVILVDAASAALRRRLSV